MFVLLHVPSATRRESFASALTEGLSTRGCHLVAADATIAASCALPESGYPAREAHWQWPLLLAVEVNRQKAADARRVLEGVLQAEGEWALLTREDADEDVCMRLRPEEAVLETVADWTRNRYCNGPVRHPAYNGEGAMLWEYHVRPVVAWVERICSRESFEALPVQLAAYLHDVPRLDGYDEDHHVRAANLMRRLLSGVTVSPTVIARAEEAILNHRGSAPRDSTSVPGRILAAADGAATLGVFPLAYFSSFRKHGLSCKDGITKALEKLDKAKSKLLPWMVPDLKAVLDAHVLLRQVGEWDGTVDRSPR